MALTLAGAHTKIGDRLKNCVRDLQHQGSVHSVLNVANGDLQLVLGWKHHTAITLHAISSRLVRLDTQNSSAWLKWKVEQIELQ